MIELPPGYRLYEYRIEMTLGSGGFGITYSAVDENLERRVAIKEYMPRHLAIRNTDHSVTVATVEDEREFRWGLDRFLDEARALAHFDHPNIVNVKRFLEANGTGYIVMEYVDGEPLSDMLKRKPTLTEAEITEHVMPLTDGLAVIHAEDMLHRDIKPKNIMVRADGAPVLIDFGSARRAVNGKSRHLTAVVTPGYAPLEQYYSMGNQGPWTDIYSLGAVLYRCVTGKTPDDALERNEQDALAPVAEAATGSYNEGLLTAFHTALAVRIEDRPCDVAAFQKLVSLDATLALDALDRSDYEAALNGLTELAELGFATAQFNLANMYFFGQGVAEDGSQAVRWLTHAAEQGHIEAQLTLGRIQYEGVNVPKDEIQAIEWFTRASNQGHDDAWLILNYIAAEQGDAERQYEMGRMFDVEMWDERKFDAFSGFEWYGIFDEVMTIQNCEVLAEIWYSRAAEQGHVKAQRELGLLYANGGDFVAIDIEVANDWLTRAAECGDSEAQYALSKMYTSGEGAPKDNAQVVQWLALAADAGHRSAQYELGRMYASGRGVPKDDAKAIVWLSFAAEQGHADAQNYLGMIYDIGNGVAQDHALAVEWYRRAADQGLATAQFNLGNNYEHGDGVPRDRDQAVHWYTRAAEQGDAHAHFELGVIYENANTARAIQHYTEAAEQGHTAAQMRLGEIYRYGLYGLAQDISRATNWFELAAEQGYTDAQFELALMYRGEGNSDYFGEGLTDLEFSLDDAVAVRWFTRAAEKGHARAQFKLGHMYFDGEGVLRDSSQALNWLTRSADKGYVPAQLDLARRYYNGEGVPKDPAQAVQWYAHAAERGNTSAQLSLSRMYSSGDGVGADGVKAYAWANLASAQGSAWAGRAVTLRDEIAARLSPLQLAAAKELSSELEPQILEIQIRDVRKRLGQIQSSD